MPEIGVLTAELAPDGKVLLRLALNTGLNRVFRPSTALEALAWGE